MSVKSYGLFSDEFIHPNDYRVLAGGDILSVDREFDTDYNNWRELQINSSFYYLTFLRDSVYLVNYLKNFTIWLDVIFLPAFQMYDDTGTVSTIYPTSVELGMKYHILKDGKWSLYLSAQGGLEFIPDYNYMLNTVFGLFGNVNYLILENLLLGFSAGTSDFQSVYLEAGCRWRIDNFDVLGAFALSGNYKIFKAGFVYRWSPGFSILWGGNYTLEYNGWNVTGGIEISQFKMFNNDSKAGLAVAYNLTGGISITLSLNMLMDRNAVPAKPEKRAEQE